MDIMIIAVSAGVIGAAMGSFVVAQVWRLRAEQLKAEKEHGEAIDPVEYKRLKPLMKRKVRSDRSTCLSCGHVLEWYDLLPIVSWLALRGRCRYCRAPIGWTELLVELAMAGLFVATMLIWPWALTGVLEWIKLIVWLVALVALAINFIYDARWFLLVSGLNWLLIGCGLVFATITLVQSEDILASLWSVIGSVAILGGLYGALWLYSRGKWVGEGDIYLGAGLALLLADWQLAFVALFAANLVGTLAILPQLVTKKLERGTHIPFGPLLIIGFLIAWFFGKAIISWYAQLVLI